MIFNSNLWYNALNWPYLYDADAFFHFRVLIRILEVISIPNHSRDSFILIKLKTYHLWKGCVIVNSNLRYNSLNWLNLYDADAFFQFRVLIRILDVISISNHSRDSIIKIKLKTYHLWKGCVIVNSNLWYNALNWPYLYDADAFFHFRVLIRILEVISIPNHSRDSFILIKLKTYHLWKGCVIVNSNLRYNSLNWLNLYDADAFFQFRVLIRILEVISIPNHSRDSFILIKLKTYHLCKGCVIINSNLWYNALNWLNLYDADAFFQFRVLIRILEVISIPNHSRDSFILIKLKTYHLWKGCVIFNSNMWYNPLNLLNLYDADAFFQFRVLIRILDVISISNHSRDSIIKIKLKTYHLWKGCVIVHSNLWYNALNWPYLYDADAFFHFRVLIRILEVISIPNHSRDSFILIKLKTYHLWKRCVIVNSNLRYNSLNWLNLYDADAFFQFRVLIRILEVISIPNHSRDSFILIKLKTYHLCKGCVIINSNLWYNALNWLNLYDADAFFQFRVLIRILEVISIPNHSRDSFILIKLKTYHLWKGCVIFNSNMWYNPLNLLNLYDADAFFQFRVLIRILDVISISNHSRDSIIKIKLKTYHLWKGCVIVNSNLWYNSLNWINL